MSDDELLLLADAEGRYVDANTAFLRATGYATTDELCTLTPGVLSAANPAASIEVWRRFVAGEFEFPSDRPVSIRRKDGAVLPARLVGIEANPDGVTWTLRMRAGEWPGAEADIHEVLDEWRAEERRLADMAPDDPGRRGVETRLEELRAVYHALSRGKAQGT